MAPDPNLNEAVPELVTEVEVSPGLDDNAAFIDAIVGNCKRLKKSQPGPVPINKIQRNIGLYAEI